MEGLSLQQSVSTGDVESARSLLDRGASANEVFEDGAPALHWAAALGHLELGELLLSHGANIAARAADGSTVLHQAAASGSSELVTVLLEHGASVTATDRDGQLPLHRAAADGHSSIIPLLAEGADVDEPDFQGRTALLIASENGNLDAVQSLLAIGATVNVQDHYGMSPLLAAALAGHTIVARGLLAMGADINVRDQRSGCTPLHIAASQGDGELVELLLASGANPAAPADDGSSPAEVAEAAGFAPIAETLREWLETAGADVHSDGYVLRGIELPEDEVEAGQFDHPPELDETPEPPSPPDTGGGEAATTGERSSLSFAETERAAPNDLSSFILDETGEPASPADTEDAGPSLSFAETATAGTGADAPEISTDDEPETPEEHWPREVAEAPAPPAPAPTPAPTPAPPRPAGTSMAARARSLLSDPLVLVPVAALLCVALGTGLYAYSTRPSSNLRPGEVPPHHGIVTDHSDVLDETTIASAVALSRTLRDKHGADVAILTVPSTGPLPAKRYARKVAASWRIGGGDTQYGIVMVVATRDREAAIDVGEALRDKLSETRVDYVIDVNMHDSLREGDFGGSISAGLVGIANFLSRPD